MGLLMGWRLGEKVNRARDWVGTGDRANEAEAVCPPQEKTGRRPEDSRSDQQRAVYEADCPSGSRTFIESSPLITIFFDYYTLTGECEVSYADERRQRERAFFFRSSRKVVGYQRTRENVSDWEKARADLLRAFIRRSRSDVRTRAKRFPSFRTSATVLSSRSAH